VGPSPWPLSTLKVKKPFTFGKIWCLNLYRIPSALGRHPTTYPLGENAGVVIGQKLTNAGWCTRYKLLLFTNAVANGSANMPTEFNCAIFFTIIAAL
jgi:hypothetical protein